MPAQVIYVPLADEGAEIWKPVDAEPISDGLFRIKSHAPPDEHWSFNVDQIVAVTQHTWSSGDGGLVAVRIGPYARIDVSEEELIIINNTLNEVCNGIHLCGEFETRIGAPLEVARNLLERVHGMFA